MHYLHRYFFFFFLLVVSGRAFAQSYIPTNVPNPTRNGQGWVTDEADLLTSAEREQLNQILFDINAQTTAEMAVAILPSIGEDIPKDFAVKLFEAWAIGKEDNDNGLLLLLVMDQHRSEFETGYGMEGVLPDLLCYRILMDEFIPRAQAGEFGAGLIATAQRVRTLLTDPAALAQLQAEVDPYRNWYYFFGYRIPPLLYWYAIVALLFHLGLLVWILITLANKDELYDKYRHVGYGQSIFFIFLFPVPYLLVYFVIRALRKRLRYQPRYSKIDGALMHLLTEEEEDPFLEEGQLAEEIVKSADYDVWITDDGSDIRVLRYARAFTSYKGCPKCHFITYKHDHTKVVQRATYAHSGSQLEYYECQNCHYQLQKTVTLPRKQRSSGGGGFSSRGGGGGGGGSSFGGGSSGGGGAGASW